MEFDTNQPLRVNPYQIIDLGDKSILVRGNRKIEIPGKEGLIAAKFIQSKLFQGNQTAEELANLFPANARELIMEFIKGLVGRGFLSPADKDAPPPGTESSQDIFYWHFNKYQNDVSRSLNEGWWIFTGINQLNAKIIQALQREGLTQIALIDSPTLRNINYYDSDFSLRKEKWPLNQIEIIPEEEVKNWITDKTISFVCAGAEFGGQYLLREWNEFAIQNKLFFYPIILENQIGYIGPLVIPGESACLECMRMRQNSALGEFESARVVDEFAFQLQRVAGYHASMVNLLAEVAAFNLIKFRTGINWEVGYFNEVDLLQGSMTPRKVAKTPRCPVCSGLRKKPLTNVQKRLASEESWESIEQTISYNE